MTPHEHHHPLAAHRLKILAVVIGVIVVALVALRIAAPSIILRVANDALDDIPGYEASIADVDLSIIQGAYQLQGLDIQRVEGEGARLPLFQAATIDLSIHWKELLYDQALVGEVVFIDPVVNVIAGRSFEETKEKNVPEVNPMQKLQELFPFTINRIEMRDGKIRYRDPRAKPPVDLALDGFFATVHNITNTKHSEEKLPSSLDILANTYETGRLKVHADFNVFNDKPTFDLNAQLEQLPLVKLNELTDAYAKFDFEGGTMSIYTEVAAAGGGFEGYVKPVFTDVQIAKTDKSDPWWRKTWEAVVGGVTEVVKNQPNDQIASKVPFEGKLEKPRFGVIQAIGTTLGNAFMKAVRPRSDRAIDIEDIQALTKGNGDAPGGPVDDEVRGDDRPGSEQKESARGR